MENTNESNSAPTLVNHAVKNGVILGVISAVLTLLLYVVDYALLVDWKVGLLTIALVIGYAVYAGISYRKEIGGYISFGKAFQHGFIAFAVSGIISTLFSILLYTVIDPELPTKMTEVAVENAEKMMAGFGMPEEQMEEALEKTRESSAGQYTVLGLAKTYLFALIGSALFALISGAIVKKKEPESV